MKDPGGAPIPFDPNQKTKTGNLEPGLSALIGYVFPLWAWIAFFTEPKEHKFSRFHALQSTFMWIGSAVIINVLSVVFVGILHLTFFGIILSLLYLATWVGGILLGLKAKKGETQKLPVIAPFAEKFA